MNKFEVQKINFSAETIDSLAHKLRLQKIDKKQIIKYKNEAIQNEKLKNKKKKACNTIQKFFRGFSYRKKFKLIINEINKKMILDYFKERRLKRIQDSHVQIIYRNIKKFLDRRNQIKKKIMLEYFNYCSNIIRRIYIGYKIRKNCKPLLHLNKMKKNKVSALINSYKVRLILKTRKIQDILSEIANIQNCLFSIEKDPRQSEKTENLKNEFTKRLENLNINFYEEFYKLKSKIIWTNYSRIEHNWFDQYFKIMTGGNVENVFQIAKNYEHEEINKTKPLKNIHLKTKNENFEKTKNNSLQFKAEQSDYVRETNKIVSNKDLEHTKTVNLDEDKYDFIEEKYEQIQEISTRTVTNIDDRPIKGNNNNMYDIDQFPEIESEVPKSKAKKIKKEKTKKVPKYDARKAIEESEKNKVNTKPNPKKEEREAFRKFLHSMKEGGEAEDNTKENIKENIKEIPDNRNTRNLKINKYRRQSTEDINEDYTEESPVKKISDKKSPQKYQENKNPEQTNPKQLKRKLTNEKNESSNANNKEDNQVESNPLVESRRGKTIKVESAMRKKLHELERSPPPRVKYSKIRLT